MKNLKRDRAYHRQQLRCAEPIDGWSVPEEFLLTEEEKEKHKQSIKHIEQVMFAVRKKHGRL